MIIDSKSCTPSILERTLGMPGEGPKMVPLILDFTAFDTYELDMSNVMQRAFLAMVQAVYVDNADNTVALTIIVNSGQQRLIVPAASQAYLPILVPNPCRISFTSPGGAADVMVFLLNYPVPPELWEPDGGAAGRLGLTTWAEFEQLSTDAFVDVADSIVDLRVNAAGKCTGYFSWINSGLNSIDVELFGYNRVDAADSFNVSGTGAITTAAGATGSDVVNSLTGIPRFLKLQVKSTAAGLSGTITGGFYAA